MEGELTWALVYDPNSAETLARRALLYLEQDRLSEAVRDLDAFERQPRNDTPAGLRQALARALAEREARLRAVQSRYERANALLLQVRDILARSWREGQTLAEVFRTHQRRAGPLLSEASRLFPGHDLIRHIGGRVQLDEGRQEAMRDVVRSVRALPREAALRLALADELLAQKHYAQALAELAVYDEVGQRCLPALEVGLHSGRDLRGAGTPAAGSGHLLRRAPAGPV